jgi:hypothetical protein
MVEGKHYATENDLAKAYYNAQKLLGVPHERLVKLPMDPTDPAWSSEVWPKLGRPEKPEGYDFGDLKPAEGAPDLLTPFREKAFEMGLPQGQAKAIVDWFDQTMETMAKAAEAQEAETAALRERTEQAEIRKEYGSAYAEAALQVEAACARFGVTEELLAQMIQGAHRKDVFALLAAVGRATGEHRTPTTAGSGVGSFEGTPAWAKQRFGELKNDKAFMDAWFKGDPHARETMERITEQMTKT